jgi:hypothetical protein
MSTRKRIVAGRTAAQSFNPEVVFNKIAKNHGERILVEALICEHWRLQAIQAFERYPQESSAGVKLQ